jgi:hypothetical protein
MGDIYPEKIIPILLLCFSNQSLNELTRLKVGEAILQVAKRCGESLQKYGTDL